MKSMSVLMCLLFMIAIGCKDGASNSNYGSTPTKESSNGVKYQIYGKYIVFCFDDMRAIKVHVYRNSSNYNIYTEKPLFKSATEDEGSLIKIDRDFLLYDYGTSPNPHLIRIYDLKNSKNLVYGGFYYFNDDLFYNGKYRIYKELGKIINSEQQMILDKTSLDVMKNNPDAVKNSNDGIWYYEEYIYDPVIDQKVTNKRIIAVLLQ